MMQYNGATEAGTWVWRPRLLTVTFDPNGGEGIMLPGDPRHPFPAQGIVEDFTLPPNAFTKDGHTFAGWNTQADGDGTAFPNGHAFTPWTQTSDMTLFAQWDAAGGGGTNGDGGGGGSGTGNATVVPPVNVPPPTPPAPPEDEHVGYGDPYEPEHPVSLLIILLFPISIAVFVFSRKTEMRIK
jgi:hypothetical protein